MSETEFSLKIHLKVFMKKLTNLEIERNGSYN